MFKYNLLYHPWFDFFEFSFFRFLLSRVMLIYYILLCELCDSVCAWLQVPHFPSFEISFAIQAYLQNPGFLLS